MAEKPEQVKTGRDHPRAPGPPPICRATPVSPPRPSSAKSPSFKDFLSGNAARKLAFVFPEEDYNMWALFYEGGQVSREYPDEAAVWRALRQAGMLNEDLFDEGYEIKRVQSERESSFV
jgi:hypothetical protein